MTAQEPFRPNVPIKINVNPHQLNSDKPGNILYHTMRYYFKPQSAKRKLTGEVEITMDNANADQKKVEMSLGNMVFQGAYEIKAKKNIWNAINKLSKTREKAKEKLKDFISPTGLNDKRDKVDAKKGNLANRVDQQANKSADAENHANARINALDHMSNL
jgi:hypothetical protein